MKKYFNIGFKFDLTVIKSVKSNLNPMLNFSMIQFFSLLKKKILFKINTFKKSQAKKFIKKSKFSSGVLIFFVLKKKR